MKKQYNITLAVLAVTVVGAGTYILVNQKDKLAQTNQSAQSQQAAQMSNLHSSMLSMSEQLKGKTGDEFDSAFINLMTEHHAGAIAMAQAIDTEAKYPELQKIATDIIAAQTKEIADMKAWAQMWGYDYKEPSQASISAMAASLKDKSGDELDKQFIIDMIAHHTGAIDMANLAAQNGKHTEIKKLANDIFMAQTAEINTMQDLAKQWGYDISSSGPSMPGHQM